VQSAYFISACAIARLHLPSSFSQGTTTTFEELTAHARNVSGAPSLPVSSITRLVRHGITNHIFAEHSPGVISHTATSLAIATFPGLRSGLEEFGASLWPAGQRLVDALLTWPDSGEVNQTGYNLASGSDGSFWADYAKDTTKMQRFADAMVFLSKKPGLEVEGFVDAVDWQGAKLVVDVGGSQGEVGRKIAEKLADDAKVVVQDREEVVSGLVGQASDRVEFQAHDFFTEQKVKGADIYVLRQILHDWSDQYCKKILEGLIPALKKRARLLVNDSVLPEIGQVSKYQERVLRHSDLMMWRMFNAKERDEADWRKLFAETDERFRVVQVIRPPGQALGIVEVEWRGDLNGK